MPELAADTFLALQLKLPTHTYRAVKRRAGEFRTELDRHVYLSNCLANCERSEGGKGSGE